MTILVSVLHCMRWVGRISMLVRIVVSSVILVILVLLTSILIVVISVSANTRPSSEIMFRNTGDTVRIIIKLSHEFLALTVRRSLRSRSLKCFLKEVVIHGVVLRREINGHHL